LALTYASKNRAPVWFHEGLAKLYERTWRGEAPSARLTPASETLLGNAAREKRLIGFERMHPSIAMLPSQEDAALAFAQVATFLERFREAQTDRGLANAIERMSQALARAPARFDLRTRLGVLYLDAGLPERAIIEFAKAREDGADAAQRARHLYGFVVTGDRASLNRALRDTDWQAAPATTRIEAAYLARIARDIEGSTALLDSARAELARTQEDIRPGYYPLRLGSCELCSLIVLEHITGHADTAAPREKLLFDVLAQHDANGLKVSTTEYYRAMISASRGETAAALASLERAIDLGWRRAWLMRIDPAFEALREHPRFTVSMRRIDDANTRTRAELESRASKLAGRAIP